MMGVAWNGPGRVPNSSRGVAFGSHRQTISSSSTLAAVMSSTAEYLVCAWPAPTYGHAIMAPGSWATARAEERRAAVAVIRFLEKIPGRYRDPGHIISPTSRGGRRGDIAFEGSPAAALRGERDHEEASPASSWTAKNEARIGCSGSSMTASESRARRVRRPRTIMPSFRLGMGLRAIGNASAAV